MPRYVVVLYWKSGRSGAIAETALASSTCSMLGESGHLAMALVNYDPVNNQNDFHTVLLNMIQTATLASTDGVNNINAVYGVVSSRYLSFWSSQASLCCGVGAIHDTFAADHFCFQRDVTVKYKSIEECMYQQLEENIDHFVQNPEAWSFRKNCSTIVKNQLVRAGVGFRNASFFQALSCFDTPSIVFDRFISDTTPEFFVVQYTGSRGAAIMPLLM